MILRPRDRPRWPFRINRNSEQADRLLFWAPLDPGMGRGFYVRDLAAGWSGVMSGTGLDWFFDKVSATSSGGTDAELSPQFGFVPNYTATAGQIINFSGAHFPSPITVSFWINFNSVANNVSQAILGEWDNAGNTWLIYMWGSGAQARISLNDTGGDNYFVWSTSNVNRWYNIVFDSAAATGYVNGEAQSMTGTARSWSSTANSFQLGKWSGGNLDGRIADVRIYSGSIHAARVRAMYAPKSRWELYQPIGRTIGRKRVTVAATQSLAGTLTIAGAMSTGILHKRLYFDSTTSASASPSFDGGWSSTTGAVRRRLNHVKGTSLLAEGSTISWANPANTKALDRQYLSGPLSGAQTISGTVKMQLLVTQLNLADNVNRLFLAVKVVSIDGGTVRGTLLSHGNYGPTAEFNCELYLGTGGGFVYRNKTGADGDALTLVNAQDGDRILVEIGYSNSTAGSTPEARAIYGEHDGGSPATDLPEDETTTDPAFDPADPPHSGWIEFSTSLLFREPTAQTLGGAPVIAGNVIKRVGKIL